MSVGIYDADLANYTLVPFSLDALKLSAYYKRHRQIVVLAKKFTPERNSQFFYVKDWDDGIYPSSLNQPNVVYRGHAFTGPTYVPMDEDIELMKPDTSLYEIYNREIVGHGEPYRRQIYDTMMKAEHIRLSLDGETLWSKYTRQFRNIAQAPMIMLHDHNLGNIEGAREAVEEMMRASKRKMSPLKFGMKFPIQATTGPQLLQWADLPSDGIFYSLRYNGVLDPEYFMEWVRAGIRYHNSSLIEYNVTGNSQSEDDFLKNHLLKLYEQVVISRSFRLKLSLTYDNDFFIDKKWEKVIDFMNCYQHSSQQLQTTLFLRNVETDTAFDFAKGVRKTNYYDKRFPFELQDIRDLFQFVRVKSPELFDAFYHTNFNSLKGEYYDLGRIESKD